MSHDNQNPTPRPTTYFKKLVWEYRRINWKRYFWGLAVLLIAMIAFPHAHWSFAFIAVPACFTFLVLTLFGLEYRRLKKQDKR
jgi:hypothetical protein